MRIINLFTVVAVTAALALSAITAKAQTEGVYFFAGFSGGTNNVLANSTNYYQTNYVPTTLDVDAHYQFGFGTAHGSPFIFCDEYTNVAVTLAALAPANFTGTVPFRFAKSYDDGGTYEANPSVIIPLNFEGTNWAQNAVVIDMIGANRLVLVDAANTNGVSITNLYGVVNFKVNKIATRQAVY